MKRFSLCSAKVLVRRGNGGRERGQVRHAPSTASGRARLPVLAALAGLALTACAGQQGASTGPSAATAPTQRISIGTDPPLATCELTREGQRLGVIEGTPGAVPVIRTGGDIIVTCRKDQHLAARQRLVPTSGGGLAARLASTRLQGDRDGGSYPSTVQLYLNPSRFEDEYARDQHFRKMRRRIEAEALTTQQTISRDCDGDLSGLSCAAAARSAEDNAARELADLEAQRRRARVVPDR